MNRFVQKFFNRFFILIAPMILTACGGIQEKEAKVSKPIATKKPVVLTKVETQKVAKEKELLAKKAKQNALAVSNYCKKIDKKFAHYGWGKSLCKKYNWQFVRTSNKGDPLIFTTFGNGGKEKDTTLIMCGVHGDEITPIKFCFDVLKYMNELESGEVIDEHNQKFAHLKDRLVVVAPIVSPDSFFKKRPTRTNANGIDINRNFPTADFHKNALRLWSKRYRKDPRRYPGKKAMSEPETIFQVNLIKRYNPAKIISVHAPLTMLDYDGPADRHTGGLIGSRANQLLIKMAEKAKGYRIKNYPFFPGSLGNYAGNERNIPTFTLELPTSDARRVKKYWNLFKPSIHQAILHDLKKDIDVALEPSDNSKSQPN